MNAFKGFRGDQPAGNIGEFSDLKLIANEANQTNRNTNVEIYENYFYQIRDIGVKTGFEGWSHNYWIHHNRFQNVHRLCRL